MVRWNLAIRHYSQVSGHVRHARFHVHLFVFQRIHGISHIRHFSQVSGYYKHARYRIYFILFLLFVEILPARRADA